MGYAVCILEDIDAVYYSVDVTVVVRLTSSWWCRTVCSITGRTPSITVKLNVYSASDSNIWLGLVELSSLCWVVNWCL